MMLRRVCVFFLSVTSIVANDEWLQVNTPQGPVRGRRMPDTEVFAFYNIPYATVPTGKNRFKAPLPPPVWTEPFNATDERVVCPQIFSSLVEKEECLIANVFVPDTKEKNLPVLVYIHGGGFNTGYGNAQIATNLIENKDMIFINFNYRLGLFGFLCLGTEDVPGNAGLKDQVAMLRWVRQNIASFGGNPDDVTIAGCSAGAMSSDILMLSKTTEGLFNKIIPESGGCLTPLIIQRNPLEVAKKHASILNFTNVDDIYALEEFYQTLPMSVVSTRPFSGIMPCVERDTGDGAILTETPFNILKNGNYKKKPILYGYANMEGLMHMILFPISQHVMNQNFSSFLPADLNFNFVEEREEVAAKVKKFYFGDEPVSNKNILGYVDFISDSIIIHPKLRAAKLYAEAGHNQVYLYEYSFVDDNTPLVPHTNVRGATHCGQSGAVLDEGDESKLSPEYRNMKKIIREIWRNFIKTGKPIPEGSSLPAWPPTGANRSPHMSLNATLELKGVPLEERTRLWDDIYQKYYEDAVPPPTPPPRPTPNGGFGTTQLNSSALLFVSALLYILQRN